MAIGWSRISDIRMFGPIVSGNRSLYRTRPLKCRYPEISDARVFLFSLLTVVPWIAAAQTPFEGVDSAVAELSRDYGWKPLKKVQCDTMDRVALKRYLEQKVKEEVKPEEIRAEEVALKKLGLAPQEFDLARTMVDLLTEQAAAFYDFKKKRLFVLREATRRANRWWYFMSWRMPSPTSGSTWGSLSSEERATIRRWHAWR